MKGILIFGAILGIFANAPALSAVRDGASVSANARAATQSRTATTTIRTNADTATRTVAPTRTTSPRNSRAGTMQIAPRTSATRVSTQTGRGGAVAPRIATSTPRATSETVGATYTRAATNMSETKTGAAYNQCKSAYFQCMDQFCMLKNDEYRRCSCGARITDLIATRKSLDETNAKLSEFTENLDVVGLTAAQATAMHTASDGENALTRDVSASKALLTAIMNSIRGEDSSVSGKWSDLNSINLSFDTTNMFGLGDTAQVVAAYNGVELYNAVYPSCRSAVAADCNDASLQRAVTAYLMAIEQDCNTVQTALATKQRELKSAIREGDAMLDLARIENRKKHNSSDMTTCINEVESAVLSEQVCGANYHKCLDNGEFIDVSTGAPIAGVVNFNELGNLLKFDFSKDMVDQKLSQNPNNKKFLDAFETKTKKFAAPALDKCTEIADAVWAEYLDKALLDIYYAQQSKVKTIQTGCFDLISSCYADRDTAITAAMSALINGGNATSLAPDKIVLTQQMCSDYIDSCNGMFGNDVIATYIESQTNTDTLAACRTVAQQCFDSFGGTNYENFIAPNSGLFMANVVDTDQSTGGRTALDWFTLYEYDANGKRVLNSDGTPKYKSVCAQRIADIQSCKDQVVAAFGGLDVVAAEQSIGDLGQYKYTEPRTGTPINAYGWAMADSGGEIDWEHFRNRRLRPTGIATEVYNQIIDGLITQCTNVQGKFVEAQFIDHNRYGSSDDANGDICKLQTADCNSSSSNDINCAKYGLLYYEIYGTNGLENYLHHENMCPKNYTLNVDTNAWGACLCWENGGRRSKHGLSGKCTPSLFTRPAIDIDQDTNCDNSGAESITPVFEHIPTYYYGIHNLLNNTTVFLKHWCTQTTNTSENPPVQPGISADNQVCPIDGCVDDTGHSLVPDAVPKGI